MSGETNSFQWQEILSFLFKIIAFRPYSGAVAVVELWICKKETVPDKDEDGSQDERDKQLDVDVVPGTVQLPAEYINSALEADSVVLHPMMINRPKVRHCRVSRAVCGWWKDNRKKKNIYFSPKEAEDGDSDGKSDKGECVSDGVHGLHIGEIPMGSWELRREISFKHL